MAWDASSTGRIAAGVFTAMLSIPFGIAHASQNDLVNTNDIVELNLPIAEEFAENDYYEPPEIISINGNGTYLWNGKPQSLAEINAAIASKSAVDVRREIAFASAESAPFQKALPVIVAASENKMERFAFLGLESLPALEKSQEASGFWSDSLGQPGATSLDLSPIVLVTTTDGEGREPSQPGYSGVNINGECRLFFGGRAVNDEELVGDLTKLTERVIQSLGGAEAVDNGVITFDDLPRPTIAGCANTPWRCVGRGIYNVQVSGAIRLGFRVLAAEID